MVTAFHRRTEGGVEIVVRLTPRSSRDAVEGVETAADGRSYLKARVRAVAEKGRANRALVALLAGWLRVPPSTIDLVAGDTARLKTLRVNGDPDAILARLAERLQG